MEPRLSRLIRGRYCIKITFLVISRRALVRLLFIGLVLIESSTKLVKSTRNWDILMRRLNFSLPHGAGTSVSLTMKLESRIWAILYGQLRQLPG